MDRKKGDYFGSVEMGKNNNVHSGTRKIVKKII
jgi:hypothetical protein